MKYIPTGILLLALTGCAGLSDRISDVTGTTLAERCASYRSALVVAKALPPSADRDQRIRVYEAAVSACPPE